MRARVLLVALGSALVVVGAPTGARPDSPPTIVVRSFTNDAGQALVAWEPRPGAVAIAFRDGTEAAEVVTASTITTWFDGNDRQRKKRERERRKLAARAAPPGRPRR